MKGKGDKFAFLLAMLGLAILTCIVLWMILIFGSMDLTSGCFYRYNIDGQGSLSASDAVSNTVTLKANANYTGSDAGVTSAVDSTGTSTGTGITLDPNSYGKWLNTNLRVKPSQLVEFVIKGEVSLCKAYIPINNLQKDTNLDNAGNRIEIPRVEDKNTPPVSLILDARTPNWKNLTELYRNDKYYVALYREKKTPANAVSIYDYFTKTMTPPADCTEGKRQYNPICGRYSLWNGAGTYTSSCHLNTQCYQCNCRDVCDSWDVFSTGWCIGGWSTVCDWCSCWENVAGTAPEPYLNNGSHTYPAPWSGTISDLWTVTGHDCGSESTYINGDFQNQKYFWFSANDPVGLISRIDSNVNPTNAASAGSNFTPVRIESDQSFYNNNAEYKIIKIEKVGYNGSDIGYLQYKLADADGAYADNTGGFVLNIKQTKCVRNNGNGMNDSVQGRGGVQYVISEYGANPNTTAPSTVDNIVVTANGKGSITAPSNGQGGYLWLKINNAPADYKDSFGQYTVLFLSSVKHGGFFDDVLNPLFEGLKTKIKTASITIFKNMTCYQGIGGQGNCTNFFNYIKGMLIIYIMFYGAMFLLGMVKISQTDIVVRVIKVAFVSGLMNDNTFYFFNNYVFEFVTGFSDSIISNMSGYSMFSGATSISNPFMFMNEVFTKIFLSPTFAAQMMALLSMGINGVLYFILLFVCLAIIIVVGFRAIAVYLMAYFAIAVLIGIAPLFLTFILFERTRYLFDNWVKFTFRYMLEPTIMLAGIIVLTQLFTIFLDYVIGYSVCWKCGIPFTIPFPSIPGFNPAFLNVPLFCFNWFTPWGFDYRSTSMGANMQNMIILLMIAYCMWGYIEYSGKIVAKLAGGSGGPSATAMGAAMSNAIENKALSKVGLDKANRDRMMGAAKERLQNMDKETKRKGDQKPGNRHDRPDKDESGSQSGGDKPQSGAVESEATKKPAPKPLPKIPAKLPPNK
jgi:type IV secretion system protein VirB6